MQWIATKLMPVSKLASKSRNIKFLANDSVTGFLHTLHSPHLVLYDNGNEGRRFDGFIMIQEQL
jgi:hypothetical protein